MPAFDVYPIRLRTVNVKRTISPPSYSQSPSVPTMAPLNAHRDRAFDFLHIWTYDPADIVDAARGKSVLSIDGLSFHYRVRTTNPKGYEAEHVAVHTLVPSPVAHDPRGLWDSYDSGLVYQSSLDMSIGEHVVGLHDAARADFFAALNDGTLWAFGVKRIGRTADHKVSMSNEPCDNKLVVYYTAGEAKTVASVPTDVSSASDIADSGNSFSGESVAVNGDVTKEKPKRKRRGRPKKKRTGSSNLGSES